MSCMGGKSTIKIAELSDKLGGEEPFAGADC